MKFVQETWEIKIAKKKKQQLIIFVGLSAERVIALKSLFYLVIHL